MKEQKLRVSFGSAFVFDKGKFIAILTTEHEYIKETSITLREDENKKVCEKYKSFMEESMGEEVTNSFTMITSIRCGLNLEENSTLMEKYQKKSFLTKKYVNEGYKILDISYCIKYLELCINSKIQFDKATFKVMMTTCFGRELSKFMCSYNIDNKRLENENEYNKNFNENMIFSIEYNKFKMRDLIFNLIGYNFCNEDNLELKELLLPINRSGEVCVLDNYEIDIKDYFINFIKGEYYLYAEIATIENDIVNILNKDILKYSKDLNSLHRIYKNSKNILFDLNPVCKINLNNIDFDKFGVLINYNNDILEFSIGYKKENKVLHCYELKNLKKIINKTIIMYVEEYNENI